MKRPHFIGHDKKIFVIHIEDTFWYYQDIDWCAKSPDEQNRVKQKFCDEIMGKLTSNQEKVYIICPMTGGQPFINIQQINGKKRTRIKYIPSYKN